MFASTNAFRRLRAASTSTLRPVNGLAPIKSTPKKRKQSDLKTGNTDKPSIDGNRPLRRQSPYGKDTTDDANSSQRKSPRRKKPESRRRTKLEPA